ncbi:MAG: Tetratricopeptide 2 repeat protein [Actinomycetia bacterium]|nr:Tetratricopeptide 2 repeat protein [Actinomycetes bacterium]
MNDAFLSYAPEDAEWGRWLADRLREAGLRVVYEEVLRSPGLRIIETLEQAIRSSRHGVLVFSRAAMTNSDVREAYYTLMRRSIHGHGRFIPVLIEDVELPEFAAARYVADLSQADGPVREARLTELVQALREEPPAPVPGPLVAPGSGVRPEKPRLATLRISATEVTWQPPVGEAVRHAPAPNRQRLDELRWRLESGRRRGIHPTKGPEGGGSLPAEYGRELGTGFLSGAAGEALRAELAEGAALGASLRLGVQVADELAHLPWEMLILPGELEPLALRSRVQLFRSIDAGTTPSMAIPGPLRILVAMAAPEGPDSGPMLDLEAELAKILDSVERPRKGARGAYVRILNEGTLSSIRDALVQERFHVLHISCHAAPGVLLLEDEQGGVDRVTTDRFVREGLSADRGVPLLVLSGCSTALDTPRTVSAQGGASAGAAGGRTRSAESAGPEGAPAGALSDETDAAALAGFARGLTAAGVPSVLAMTAPITDLYATALAGSLYTELALRSAPEVLPAFCDARRRLEESRRREPAGSVAASLVEWATPALFLRGPSLPLYDSADEFEEIAPPVEPRFADGVPLREVGEFVGRRSELRALRRALNGSGRGVVLHGIGGVGKSSLAAELLRQGGAETGIIVSAVSETSPDQLLDELGQALLDVFSDDGVRGLASRVRQPQYEWAERLRALGPLLAQVPVTLLLDNFEDNLVYADAGWAVRNSELAEFLTAWIRLRGKHKLLVTSRYPFPLPQRAERRLTTHHLGPLSWAETRKLIWRLPGLDALPPADQRRAWADVGGHPRTLEYLDALLRGGEARFDDVRERLEGLLDRRGIPDPDAWFRTTGPDVDAALAEAVTLAVDDTLLHDLLGLLDDFTREVLVGASVFRVPVDRVGVAWPVSVPADPDPSRDRRLVRLFELLKQVREVNPDAWLGDLGLSAEELEQAEVDVASFRIAPVVEPEGLGAAVEVLGRLGLLAPVGRPGEESGFVVHRWTAGTLTHPGLTGPGRLAAAHRSAAEFWEWRVGNRGRSQQQQEVMELLEVRFHRHAAGDLDEAAGATDRMSQRLRLWGAWGWEEQLHRETVSWFVDGSRGQAVGFHELGLIAGLRGEYEQALDWYRKSLTIYEELGDRAGLAGGYHQFGIIAQHRGEYEQALDWYRRSLTIHEELGDRAGIANGYHQFGNIALLGGEYEQALDWYRKSLTIHEELGGRADVASGYHHLGMIAQLRGEYEQALDWYRKSLTINEELGNRADVASTCHELGIIAQHHGAYEQALVWYRRSLTIDEELGDQVGIGTSCCQIGATLTEAGAPADAVPYSLRSLQICIDLGLHQLDRVLPWLVRQRAALGDKEFRRCLADRLNAENVDTVIAWLDQKGE